MPPISEKSLEQLRSKGLLAMPTFGSNHRGYPNGCWIGKPVGVKGNSCPGIERPIFSKLDDQGRRVPGPMVDAPVLVFGSADTKYYVSLEEGIGERLPYDFINEWSSLEEAVADIIDFYFGDAARVQKYIDWHDKHNN